VSIGLIILSVLGILWIFGGGVYCWNRCVNTYYDENDKYFTLKLICCHIIEGPIAWFIGLFLIMFNIIEKVENILGIN